ncbi:META domain-containing protein [Streptomyces piniterrae]|uniref:META domain-containing protein n=1 Tax=Streptomyces piniterrae TaxID=2571125 RepID=UPI00145EEFB6|nr:META domain-containing protein [Streptomyces piniterrae]
MDGEKVEGSYDARPWVEFHEDGTVSGDYGCTPFRVKAELEAAELTMGEDLPVPTPSATPAPPTDGEGLCVTPDQQKKSIERYTDPAARKWAAEGYAKRNKGLADFEAKVKKFLRGQLKITAKQLPPVPGGPPPGSLPQLRNQDGDVVTLAVVRHPGFFDTRYQLTARTAYDSSDGFKSGKDLYFDFHPNGTVTGKLGCNDFTADVFFTGSHVFFRDPELTTHRTCAAQNMEDESNVLERLKRSLNYSYRAASGGMLMSDDVSSEHLATGFHFTATPKR